MVFHHCNSVTLYARMLGSAARPIVVFANSLGTDARIWDAMIPLFLERYRVLVYDKRGHGLSDAPQGSSTISQHAADLLSLVDSVGATEFALVGLSVGGMIAQHLAAERPDRVAALVLSSTAARIGEAESWNSRIKAVEEDGIDAIADAVLERWFTTAYRAHNATAMRGWRNMLTRQPAHGYTATCAAIRDADLRAHAAAIRSPTLVTVGDQDLSTPPETVKETADRIRNARFEIIPGSGHLPCIEQAEALSQLALRHLSETGFR